MSVSGRAPVSVGQALADVEIPEVVEEVEDEGIARKVGPIDVLGDGPLVVREKEFDAVPLTLAQALDEMELVGHDFFLYQDAESGRPAVVAATVMPQTEHAMA